MDYFDEDIPEAIEDPFADETPNGNTENGENQENPENSDKTKKLKKKRTGMGPRSLQEKHLLNPKTGLLALPKHFLNGLNEMKHYEEGKELENINDFMYNIERWCHNMYPKWQLDGCLEKIERLGMKMPIKNAMVRMRAGDEMFAYEMEERFREEERQIAEKENNPGMADSGNNPGNPEESTNVNQYANPQFMQPSGYGISTSSLQKTAVPAAPAALSGDMQAKIAENRRKALERRKQREEAAMATSSQDEL